MAVQVIKATKQTQGLAPSVLRNSTKMKVAAYCRVSTDSDEQETSYEAQCRHYTDFISANPEWEMAGIYADEGISGTSTRKREQFNKMIADCEAGLIDMVITKSISRWARNTIDSLQNIRKLKDLGIPVLFEKENINTMDAKGEVLITIMSSIAQQESESISKNVRIGIQYGFQQGKGRLNTTQFLGLEKGEDGRMLVIIPEEAALVRRIYREYLEGYSPGMIAGRLTADEILTPAGKKTWYQSTVVSILENEKYCGDLLMQKYFVVDFLTHKIIKNTGQLPQYYVEDAHEPIIPKPVFFQVQGEMQRRSLLRSDPTKLRFGSTMALSGRLVCGRCGRVLKRYTNPNPQLIDWRCRKRSYNKRSITREVEPLCPCRNVPEREAKMAIITAFNQLPAQRDELIRMQGAVWNGTIGRIDAELNKLEEQQERITDRLDSLPEEEADQAAFLKEELNRMGIEHTSLLLDRADAANKEVQIRLLLELVDAMKEQREDEAEEYDSPACYDYDEFFRRTRYVLDEGIIGEDGKVMSFSNDMVIRYLDNVVIQDDAYEVNFKCGLTVRVAIHE
ncbi:MAG: recombinase family protein [Blautia sp.]|nr:recombinase family protein [Blautia sp.]